jgi:UDP-2,3-diacylglucosamine pyrophosphatase LpxH
MRGGQRRRSEVTPRRAVFVSDAHIGARASKAARFRAFLEANPADALYIVGDLFDGLHALRAPDLAETLRALARAPRVVFIPGNHDELFRRFVGVFGRLEICARATHVGGDGRRYVVTHGDEFDGSLRGPLPWLGSYARYVAPRAATRAANRLATGGRLAAKLSALARSHEAAGVITGHWHDPGLRRLPCGALAGDCGDWLTHCSAIVEDFDGQFQLLRG